MFSLFIAYVKSAEHHKYRVCDQSPFCARNINATNSDWVADPSTEVISDSQYSVSINANIKLILTFLKSKAVHVRVEPIKPEAFRFDLSAEPTVINQEAISPANGIKAEKLQNQIKLNYEDKEIVINYQPVQIIYSDKTGKRVVIDPVVFETGIPLKGNEELFKEYSFGGWTDKLKNGPTAVSIDATFYANNVKLSGLPSHTLHLNLPATDSSGPIRFWNTDINRYEVDTPMSMYGAVPFLWAHGIDSYSGLFWANPSETWVNISYPSTSEAKTRFISEGGYIDFYLFSSTQPDDVIDQYTQITGRPYMAPLFSLGFHQCRWGYMTQDEVHEVDTSLDQLMVPHDVLWLDLDHADDRKYFTWHPTNFKDPQKLLSQLNQNHRYLVTLSDPHLKAQTSYRLYKEASDKKLLVLNGDRNEYKANCWPGQSAWPDFFNPATRSWWEEQYSYKNYDSAPNLYPWNDMNEISVFDSTDNSCPRDLIHYQDIEEREVHNLYGHMMVSSTFGGLIKRNADHNIRPFILTRSFFAGTQKYSAIWSGDNTGDWPNLENSLPLVLHYSICGIHQSGVDVGGFFDSPKGDLLSRWYNVGAWIYPFYRCHCHHLSEHREIYKLEGADRELAIDGVKSRYQYLPLWYTLMRKCNLTGSPIVRPLWWRYPEIERDDVVMIGSELLVVPFLQEGEKDVMFDFPESDLWYPIDGTKFDAHKVKYDKGKTKVFQRGGSIVPTRMRIRKSAELMHYDPYTLTVCVDKEGKAVGELYDDDGKTFDFMKLNKFVHKEYSFDGKQFVSKDKIVGDYEEYTAKVERIVIKGVEKPSNVKVAGNDVEFEFVDGILTLHRINTLVRDNWVIDFEY